MNMNPVAIIDGVRTPFCKAHGILASIHAADLGADAVSAVIRKPVWLLMTLTKS